MLERTHSCIHLLILYEVLKWHQVESELIQVPNWLTFWGAKPIRLFWLVTSWNANLNHDLVDTIFVVLDWELIYILKCQEICETMSFIDYVNLSHTVLVEKVRVLGLLETFQLYFLNGLKVELPISWSKSDFNVNNAWVWQDHLVIDIVHDAYSDSCFCLS